MKTVLQALNHAIHQAMEADARVYFLGEDILDPYGGAFKVSRGLSTRFPDRVLTTPISEAALVGIANGMALQGLRPVVEIMFGDFLTLACDQIVNHAAKFRWMYNDQVRVPIVIRTPMGGRRGYGPTHSQSLEKHWLGVPGLRVVAPNTVANPMQMLVDAILRDDDPVLFIEHKLLYGCKLFIAELNDDWIITSVGSVYPTATVRLREGGFPKVTFACYGYMFELVREAMMALLLEHEVFSETVVVSQLSPMNIDPLFESATRTGHLVTVEEASLGAGWGSEVIAGVAEKQGATPAIRFARVGAKDVPIGASRILEDQTLPSVGDIIEAALKLVK